MRKSEIAKVFSHGARFVIDKGRVIERGTHKEMVDAGGKYAHSCRQFVMHSE